MILLSKVIKSIFAKPNDSNKKQIQVKQISTQNLISQVEPEHELVETNTLTSQDIINEAHSEAAKIHEEARNEYEQLKQRMSMELEEHQKLAEEICVNAEKNGYNEGFQQGLEEGEKQFANFIEQAKSIVNASRQDYLQKLEDSEPVIIDLAMKVANKIVSRTLSDNEQAWMSVVKDVLKEVREQELVKLYVHPNWFEKVLTYKTELQLLLPNSEDLLIYPDEILEENGCIIETKFGRIDASIDSQLTEIKYALLEKLKENGYEGS